MKKIGIITFHTALNYGAVMQTYALQQFLEKKGICTEIIDYRSPFIDKCYRPFFISNRKILNSLVRGILFGRIIKNKRTVFEQFSKCYLHLSRKYLSSDEIEKDRDDYSFFISGSDQVWSTISAGFDPVYFLPFAKNEQKISYAASIGTNSLSDAQCLEYKKRLNGFSCLSVRETSAVDLLQKLDPHRKIYVHIDPTLLLQKDSWFSLLSGLPVGIPENYLLLFNVENPISDIAFAKSLANKRKLKIVYINDRTVLKDRNIIYVEAPPPDIFLTLFANANIVVTNSFHGTVFSIIFQKEFYVELENKKQKNIRIENLLKELEITGKDINDLKNQRSAEINWTRVYNILHKKQKEASDYFDDIVKNKRQ